MKSWLKTMTRRPKTVAVAGDDRVADGPPLDHPELGLAVADVAVELDERARVAQLLGPLAREQLPGLALLRHGRLASRRGAPGA